MSWLIFEKRKLTHFGLNGKIVLLHYDSSLWLVQTETSSTVICLCLEIQPWTPVPAAEEPSRCCSFSLFSLSSLSFPSLLSFPPPLPSPISCQGWGSTLHTAHCLAGWLGQPLQGKDTMSVVHNSVNAESLQKPGMERNNFLTVLFCEVSSRFRQKRHGKNKSKNDQTVIKSWFY